MANADMNLATPDPPEVHLVKQVEAILYSFAKFHELKLLTEMNGRNCAMSGGRGWRREASF